jgi:iron-sulfur cluster assembly accessory protein
MSEVKQFDPNTIDPVTLSDKAIKHVKAQLKKQADSVGFRLYVTRTGCTGYMYKVDYVTDVIATDLVFPIDDDLTIYVDSISYPFIKGTHVVLEKKGLNEVLIYQNPNAEGNCGCGESFVIPGDEHE